MSSLQPQPSSSSANSRKSKSPSPAPPKSPIPSGSQPMDDQQQQMMKEASQGDATNKNAKGVLISVKEPPAPIPCPVQQQQLTSGMIPYQIWLDIERSELQPGVILNAVPEYAGLLLGYLVQERLIEAKYCWMRANERWPRVPQLKAIWDEIGRPMVNGRYERALKFARVLTMDGQPLLQLWIEELRSRLLASQLKLVAKCYTNIHIAMLVDLLGLDPLAGQPEAVELVTIRCGWQFDPTTGYIQPSTNDLFKDTVDGMINITRFGPLSQDKEKFATLSNDSVVMDNGQGGGGERLMQELKNLISCTAFFDRQKQQLGEGGTNSGNKEQQRGSGSSVL